MLPQFADDLQIAIGSQLDLVDRPAGKLLHFGDHFVRLGNPDRVVSQRHVFRSESPQLIYRLTPLLAPQIMGCLVERALGEGMASELGVQLGPQFGRIVQRHSLQLTAHRFKCCGHRFDRHAVVRIRGRFTIPVEPIVFEIDDHRRLDVVRIPRDGKGVS